MDQATKASLARDAMLMRDLRKTEAWDCILHQLGKMELLALDHLSAPGEPAVEYWRGRYAAVREVRTVPDLIVNWSETLT